MGFDLQSLIGHLYLKGFWRCTNEHITDWYFQILLCGKLINAFEQSSMHWLTSRSFHLKWNMQCRGGNKLYESLWEIPTRAQRHYPKAGLHKVWVTWSAQLGCWVVNCYNYGDRTRKGKGTFPYFRRNWNICLCWRMKWMQFTVTYCDITFSIHLHYMFSHF